MLKNGLRSQMALRFLPSYSTPWFKIKFEQQPMLGMIISYKNLYQKVQVVYSVPLCGQVPGRVGKIGGSMAVS